jgi:hypothetical protein
MTVLHRGIFFYVIVFVVIFKLFGYACYVVTLLCLSLIYIFRLKLLGSAELKKKKTHARRPVAYHTQILTSIVAGKSG